MKEYMIIIYLLVINLITFVVYAIDKWKAKKRRYRISEATLMMLAALGGSIGALAAMYTIRHKTRHAKFTIGVPVLLILQVALAVWLMRLM